MNKRIELWNVYVMRRILLFLIIGLFIASNADMVKIKMTIDGVERYALVYPGDNVNEEVAPVVFAFHGYSSSAVQMSYYDIHTEWPEATVVYPQGYKCGNRLKDGWQHALGENNDRDVKFVSELLKEIKKRYKVDSTRIYATGMSNGALFCYVLMAKMPDTFAAFAPVCGASQLMEKIDTPRPMMFIFGAKDTNMPISWGLWVLQYAKKLNGCGDNKSEWIPGYFLYTPDKTGCKLIWRVHPDGHIWPNDATENIVRFFKGEKLADDEVID